MINIRMRFQIITWLLFIFVFQSVAQTDAKKGLVYQLQDEISPGSARILTKVFEESERIKADFLVIRMNTYGGELISADSMRSLVLRSRIPVFVLVENNAASAGALISLAANKIYMLPGSSIGAATVVNERAEALPDKYQSYMRSMMRSTAETRGRNPHIAEAMVDGRIVVTGLNDSGRVVTLTANEAVKWKISEAVVNSLPEMLTKENLQNAKLVTYKISALDRFIGWVIHPAISGVLILLMLGGLYYEMQHPGIGLPLLIAIVAAILYFAPMYLEGLAENWEILLSIAGIGLILAEIFIIPGFGITGISGIALMVAGLVVSMLPNKGFDFQYVTTISIYTAVAIILISMSGVLLLFILTSKLMLSSPFVKRFSLQTEMSAAAGYTTAIASGNEPGVEGIAVSDFRPSGKVEIDGIIYSATSEGDFISAGTRVVIVRNRPGITVKAVG